MSPTPEEKPEAQRPPEPAPVVEATPVQAEPATAKPVQATAATAKPVQAAAAAPRPARPAEVVVRPAGTAHQGGISGWIREEGAWWAASFVFHTLLMAILMLVPHTVVQPVEGEAISLDEAKDLEELKQPPQLERFELTETQKEDTVLTTESLSLTNAPEIQSESLDLAGVSAEGGGMKATSAGPQLGGMGGFTIVGLGAGSARKGAGGIGFGPGTGSNYGSGGSGFGHREGLKRVSGTQGGTKAADRAVGAALSWFARHQSRDGSWGLSAYRRQCKDPSCSGPGTYAGAAAGTALAILPYLAAGQTHETKGPYRKTIYDGLYFLMKNQSRTGDLSGAKPPQMYVHGLATIALCEAYGLTHSKAIGKAAQQAVFFIESAQNRGTGGWRYTPGQDGDTSVVGWQVMALKSAQMAGLQVKPETLEGAKRFLKSCAKGRGGVFSYTPESGPTPSMTSVGLLCLQYGGMRRSAPEMSEGVTLLMSNLPERGPRNIYYWYYATQVMHNVSGSDWDRWNRSMRNVLRETQCKEKCATGSWDPDKPTRDAWAEAGGRLMVTSLATLSLEVYYRYLPLYKIENTDTMSTLVAPPPPPSPGAPAKSATPPSKPAPPPAKAAAPAKPAAKPATPAPAKK